jgi:CRISPR-associated endoribonuclease Cas6
MRITLNFGPTVVPFSEPTQNYVNGLIHTILGKDNHYHDKFSNYSVSFLRGGKLTSEGLIYPDGGKLYISSPDETFIETFLINLIHSKNVKVRDMALTSYDISDISVNAKYDIIETLSPILLKENGKRITFKDSSFLSVLERQCVAKLTKNGLTSTDLKGFIIKPFHFEKARVQLPKIKNVVNPSSQVMLVIEGTVKARKMLYEMGLGNSTGCGFGAVKVRH